MKTPIRHCRTGAFHARALSLAVCSVVAIGASDIALAPCLFQFDAAASIGADNTIWIQLTLAGNFKPRDGRNLPVDHWHIDAATANAVIARFRANQTPPVIDYEHQTLLAETNGQPAPAAGRLVDMQWREGQGLFGQIELTARAKQYIAAGEYKYFSPVFLFDVKSGDVLDIVMGALTNNPALDGMQPIALRAAARYAIHREDINVNKLHAAVCSMLGLNPDNTTEDQAVTALQAHTDKAKTKTKADPLAKARAELGLAEDADESAVTVAVAALKSRADAARPDPAKFVGVEVLNDVRTQLATLTAKIRDGEVDEVVQQALDDGRLLKAQEPWARELGKSDIASLRSYITASAPIAALRGSQTGGKTPSETDHATGLTSDELAVCKASGIAPEDFAKTKQTAAA